MRLVVMFCLVIHKFKEQTYLTYLFASHLIQQLAKEQGLADRASFQVS